MTYESNKPVMLSVDDLSVRFGGVQALDQVAFDAREGELTAIIGPNGAGKTTLFNCMTGVYRPTSGKVVYRDKHVVTRLAQHKIARLGVARTFQNLALFQGLSVLDNLMVGRYLHGRSSVLKGMFYVGPAAKEDAALREYAEFIIDFLHLQAYRHVPVGDLPYGLQKRVEFGRALCQQPDLLLLDEPMAGMAVEEKEDMARFVLDCRDEFGMTIVLVEHDMGVVMDIAERVVVLDFGKLIADDVPAVVQRDDAVIAAYLGPQYGRAAEEQGQTTPSAGST